MKDEAFMFFDGLKKLSNTLNGDENIYLGIRPYGFHSGNQIVFNIYPELLCEFIEKNGKKAKFNFYIFINDWEQDAFAETKDFLKEYPFNISPKNTTFQFLTHTEKNIPLVDYWESVILESFYKNVKSKFKDIKVKTVRNSQMRNSESMKNVVLQTIKNPDLVSNVLKEYSGKKFLDNRENTFCRAICPNCHKALTKSIVLDNDDIKIQCSNCGFNGIRNYYNLYFWLYHKPLALPRIYDYKIDLCITGADHYNEGDFIVRQELFKKYKLDIKIPKTLYTPILYGRNHLVMGKSKNNAEIVEYDFLKQKVLNNGNNNILNI